MPVPMLRRQMVGRRKMSVSEGCVMWGEVFGEGDIIC